MSIQNTTPPPTFLSRLNNKAVKLTAFFGVIAGLLGSIDKVQEKFKAVFIKNDSKLEIFDIIKTNKGSNIYELDFRVKNKGSKSNLQLSRVFFECDSINYPRLIPMILMMSSFNSKDTLNISKIEKGDKLSTQIPIKLDPGENDRFKLYVYYKPTDSRIFTDVRISINTNHGIYTYDKVLKFKRK